MELVARWRNGDQEAASELFHRYFARLLALADSRLSAKLALRANAEDDRPVLRVVRIDVHVSVKSPSRVIRADDLIDLFFE